MGPNFRKLKFVKIVTLPHIHTNEINYSINARNTTLPRHGPNVQLIMSAIQSLQTTYK